MAGRCAPGAALRTLPTVAAVRAHARQAQRLGWCCVLLMLTIQAVQWQGALRSSGSMPAPRPAAAAPPAPAPVAAAAAPLLCGGDAKAPRNSTSQGAALLDDIPPSAATNISSYAPVFLALADMAYAFDHVAGSRRRGAAPCLTAWGARGAALEVRAPGDADRRALVFRTRRDVVVTIRGMDGGGSFRAYGDVTPTFDPRYFGAPPSPVPPPPELPQAAYRTRRPFADPDLFWVLRRDYAQLRLLEAPLMEAVDALVMQMDPKARSQHRVWLTGHSSGGAPRAARGAAPGGAARARRRRRRAAVQLGPRRERRVCGAL
ncbi:MAG: hypothetical protein J3K34DRAFT_274152 [Monoraphidium minutum]|nr:MAG: hypothetical protein J3K34DRAFT_274152 [Monoraphidium minutum]